MRVSLCLSSMIIFTDGFWNSVYVQRVLLVRGSRLKNEENMRVFLCLSSMIIFTDRFWNSVYWQSTELLVRGSRLKNEENMRVCFPLFLLSDYFHRLLLEFGVLAEYCWFSAHALRARYTRCSFSLHAACCDKNASGHHHYNKMQVSDWNY